MSPMEATMTDDPVWYQVTGSTARPIRDARFRRAVVESRRLARALLAWRGISLIRGTRSSTLAQRECARRRHALTAAECESVLMVASADDSARGDY